MFDSFLKNNCFHFFTSQIAKKFYFNIYLFLDFWIKCWKVTSPTKQPCLISFFDSRQHFLVPLCFIILFLSVYLGSKKPVKQDLLNLTNKIYLLIFYFILSFQSSNNIFFQMWIKFVKNVQILFFVRVLPIDLIRNLILSKILYKSHKKNICIK